MTTKITYCQFTEGQIEESGLLSPERMAEVSAAINARIVPCCLPDGKALTNAFVADHGEEGKFVYARCDNASAFEYMRRSVLPAVLTPEELECINEHCLSARETELNEKRFKEAKKVEAWDDGAWLGDNYYHSMDDLCDHLECEGEEWPEYVWGAKPKTVIHEIDVADVFECQICDHGWEDMSVDDLKGVEELQAALNKFVEANAVVYSFLPDYKTAVLLAPWKAANN